MHIPDGLIWPPILVIGWVIALVAIAISIRKTTRHIPEDKIPTMAVLAAGIFVAQMLNFPIIGGTSGHLIGAAIATAIVGPWAAILIMSVVIIIQGLMFGDGGILSLGINLTNMAVTAVAVSWAIIRLMRNVKMDFSVAFSAWAAVFVASLICALELAFSYSMSPEYGIIGTISIPTMAGFHAIIAIGEAAISTGVIAYLAHVSPEIVQSFERKAEVTTQ